MTQSDPYFFHWESIVDNEIRKPLLQIREVCGDDLEAVGALGRPWDIGEVTRLLKLEPLPQLPGPVIFRLTPEQLRSTSPTKLRILVRCAIVKCMEHLGSTLHQQPKSSRDDGKRILSRFFGEDHSFVRRVMVRPEYGQCLAALDHPADSQTTTGRSLQMDQAENAPTPLSTAEESDVR